MMLNQATNPKSKYHIVQKSGESQTAYITRARSAVQYRAKGINSPLAYMTKR